MNDKDFTEQDAKIRYVCVNVSSLSRLIQLSEECAEYIQAVSKYLRTMSQDNPTPKSEKEIIENLKEEIMDIQLCLDCIAADMIDYKIYERKLNRWVRRLKGNV